MIFGDIRTRFMIFEVLEIIESDELIGRLHRIHA